MLANRTWPIGFMCVSLFYRAEAQAPADIPVLKGLAPKTLTETEGPGGGFLDDGSSFGVYSRLNLYAAAARAQQDRPH